MRSPLSRPSTFTAAVIACGLAALAGPALAEFDAAAQLETGTAKYKEVCAICHGEALEGAVHAPPLVGDTFWTNWEGKPQRLLYSRIISTMPQAAPGTLPPEDALAITLSILEANGVRRDDGAASPNDLNGVPIVKP